MAVLHLGFTTFSGLSTDAKPASATLGVGSNFYETDTGKSYIYDGSAWVKTGTVTAQTEPLSPVNVSASPTREEIQGMLDYAKEISSALVKTGAFKLLPTIVGRLDPGATEFGFKTDPGEKFTVEQDGTVRTFTCNPDGRLATKVGGVHDNSDITITLPGSSTFFKFANHPSGASYRWVSITLVALGDITTLYGSFRRMLHLTSFDCIADTSKVTNFGGAWIQCNQLTSFPRIDTSSGVNFQGTWAYCSKLQAIPNVDLSSATNLREFVTFSGTLQTVPHFDTGSATNMLAAFDACASLTTIPLLDTSSVTDFTSTWMRCEVLNSLPAIDTSNGITFSKTWDRCRSLVSLPALDTSSGTNFKMAWSNCKRLACINGTLDFEHLTSGDGAFENCSNLVAPPDPSKVRKGNAALKGTWTNTGTCP